MNLHSSFYHTNSKLFQLQINGNKIEKNNSKILQVTKAETPFNWLNSIYSLLALFNLSIFKQKWIKISYFIFAGNIRIFFSLVGLYSLHEEILWNYNILLFNPLLLVLLGILKGIKDKLFYLEK